MKVQLYDVTFDDSAVNPMAVYRPGQVISCHVHLKLLEPVKCRAVYVKLYGNSYVHWTEQRTTGSGNNKRTETVHYTSQEVYVDQKVPLYTPEATGPNAEHHPAGEFVYAVSFQLPLAAPSSFEGEIGWIRYMIKSNIDRPWKIDNYTQKFFTVIRDLDLNLKPIEATGPFSTSDEYDVNCCYCCNCGLGQVRVNVSLPKKGYVPGEHVHVTGEITNTSKTALNSVNLEILQRTIFHASGRTRTSSRVASAVHLEGLAEGQSVTLNHFLPLNPMPSSYIEGCNNIDMQYFFRLYCDGGCCLSVKKECCELVIGTLPLWSIPIALPPALSLPPLPLPGAPTETVRLLQPEPLQQPQQPSAPTMPPPPSYGECMFGRVEMAKEEGKSFGGQTQWAPSYPVFSMPLQQQPPQQQQQQQPQQQQSGGPQDC